MQSLPIFALPGVVPAKAQAVDNISASGLPVAEAAVGVTFETLLAQQTQVRPALQSDNLALLIGQQDASKEQIGKDDSSSQDDPSVMVTDLASLFATLIQAAAPITPSGQAIDSANAGADVAQLGEAGAGARRGALPLMPGNAFNVGADVAKLHEDGASTRRGALPLMPGNALPAVDGAVPGIDAKPGKDAAEIAGTGKDLPFVDAKLNVEAKVNVAALQSDELGAGQNSTQVNAQHSEVVPQIAPVPGNNDKGAVTVSVEPRVGAPGWDSALGQKVVWLANQRHQTAEMQLNPPNLGPLEVKITISNDQASALFVSHHAAVRDAIEAALPRLREMLAESGITLGNAQVSAESFPREQHNSERWVESGWQAEAHDMAIPDVMGERTGVMRLRTPGSVDIFA